MAIIIFLKKKKNYIRLALLCLLCLSTSFLKAQAPEQDCINAIPVCNENIYSQPNSYIDEGVVLNEIDGLESCLSSGEKNGVWYKITIPQDGTLKFTIVPAFFLDDYDWAVYNLTNASCSDIATNPSLEVSCNFSGDFGDTGPNGMGNESSQGGGGTPYNATIPVQTGETYYIYISNYSDTQDGYTIDFTGSPTPFCSEAGTIFAALNPGNSCSINSIQVQFSKPIVCTSAQTTDFKFTSPSGANIPITALQGQNCDSQTASPMYYMTLGQTLTESGVYTLTLVNSITANTGESYSVDVIQQIIQPQPSTLRFFTTFRKAYVCPDCSDGRIVISGIGGQGPYSYSINNGQSFQASGVFNNLSPGTYLIMIKDSAGCTVVRTITLGS